MHASESVQYFQFDQEGNMFVFEPGSGFSGPSVKVQAGFEFHEMYGSTPKSSVNDNVYDGLVSAGVSEVPRASSSKSEPIQPTPIKR